MGVKHDAWIRMMAREHDMITPFADEQVRDGVISYGVSSYGYDARLDRDFKVFTSPLGYSGIIDPKHFDVGLTKSVSLNTLILPPHSFTLAHTMEYFRIPRDVLVICIGKSTYARCGLIVNITPLEPEWEGQVTIEISNTTPLPAKVYAGEGIAQFVFLEATVACECSYADRQGKYQDQHGIVLPRL